MSRSNDADHFFQTSSSLAETTRKAKKASNTHGDPIRLPSKILAVIADPADNGAVYVGESAGTARRVVLDTGSKSEVFRSPTSTAPLTSLALAPPSAKAPTKLFAASWDKSIHSWELVTRAPSRRFVGGHTDFVKCVVTTDLQGKELLISGDADATIVLWDISSGARLQTLRTGHSRGILDLAIDPESYAITGPPGNGAAEHEPFITLFTASSDRTIRRFTLHPSSPASPLHLTESHPENPIISHETSVNALHFPLSSSDDESDLYTASADGTSKCLSRSRNWEPDTTLPHGDYVRAVVVSSDLGLIVTAGRSEDVKVWEAGSGELVHSYEGHYDEITGLVLVHGGRGIEVVSVGIDGTVRRWGLGREELERARREGEEEAGRRERGELAEEDGGDGGERVKGGLLTEEEERELEALMEEG